MVRISVDIDEDVNIRLMAYAVKTMGRSHGTKGKAIAAIVKQFLDQKTSWIVKAADGEKTAAPTAVKPMKKTTRKSPIAEDDQLKIKEAWEAQDPEQRNISEVARQFPKYTDRQVRHFIEKNLKS